MVQNKSLPSKIFVFLNTTLMTTLVIMTFYPFYYAFINSLNHGQDTINLGYVLLVPRYFTTASWVTVLNDPAIVRAIYITVARTVLVTISSIFITSMFAYAFSRPYLRWKKVYATLGFISMYISGGLIAFFLLISVLGLYNNFWVYVIPSMFGGFFQVIIFSSNFKGLPDSLFESAKLDGASEFKIYTWIVIPLSKAVIAALSVFTAVGTWNDFQTTLFFTDGVSINTLQYYIVQLVRHANAVEQLMASAAGADGQILGMLQQAGGPASARTVELAAMVIAAIPILLLYPFAQRHFAQGVLIGSIKG